MTDQKNNSERQSREDDYLFVELFTANYNRIKSFIYTLVPNYSDAEDIMQETARVIWEKFNQFEKGTHFINWALTIARFQVMHYRKKHPVKISFNDDLMNKLADEAACPLEKDNERIEALKQCLDHLNRKDNDLIRYRFENKITARILSQRLGVAINTIYRNETRIYARLLSCIRKRLGIEEI